jgi:hypothetical protein
MPAMDNLEKFINRDDVENLVQLAQMHAQFELIHLDSFVFTAEAIY